MWIKSDLKIFGYTLFEGVWVTVWVITMNYITIGLGLGTGVGLELVVCQYIEMV